MEREKHRWQGINTTVDAPPALREDFRQKYLGLFHLALPFEDGEIETLDRIFGMAPVNGVRPPLKTCYHVRGHSSFLRKVGAYFLLSQNKRLEYRHLTTHDLLCRFLGRTGDENQNKQDYLDLLTPVLILHQSKSRVPNKMWTDLISEAIIQRVLTGSLITIFLDGYEKDQVLVDNLEEYGIHFYTQTSDEALAMKKKKKKASIGSAAVVKVRRSDPV